MAKPLIAIQKSSFELSGKNALRDCLSFIEGELTKLKTDNKLLMRSTLISEEIISEFIEKAAPGEKIHIKIQKFFGETGITISCRGEEFDPYEGADGAEGDSQKAIKAILLKSYGSKLSYSHKNGVNSARILVGQSERKTLMKTVIALVLGVACGLLMKFVFPEVFTSGMTDYVLVPVKTIFMNAIRIVVCPLVFFSIVSCFSQFRNLSELGKVGAKVMGTYMLTTVIAVLIAFSLSLLIKPGEWGFAIGMIQTGQTAGTTANVDTSLLNTIVGIVPSNFLAPFFEGNTLQIIFLAVLCGAAVGKIGEHAEFVKQFFEAFNSLFMAITAIISRFMPVAIFASISILISQIDAGSLKAMAAYVGTFLLGILSMLIIYGLLILIIGRLNPLTFYRKNREGMLTSFSLVSSTAAMPTNLKVCTEKLGISQKISNFSIPLGATINMDGGCINLAVTGLFLARAFGVEVPMPVLISAGITIMLLSLSAPGVPGAGLVIIGVVLSTLGVPLEAIALIIGIYPIFDMFITLNNTTGDVAAALIVARSEGELDMSVYNSKKA